MDRTPIKDSELYGRIMPLARDGVCDRRDVERLVATVDLYVSTIRVLRAALHNFVEAEASWLEARGENKEDFDDPLGDAYRVAKSTLDYTEDAGYWLPIASAPLAEPFLIWNHRDGTVMEVVRIQIPGKPNAVVHQRSGRWFEARWWMPTPRPPGGPSSPTAAGAAAAGTSATAGARAR